MKRTRAKAHPSSNRIGPQESLLTKEELRAKLNLPSTKSISGMMRRRKIPFIKIGHRTVRFDLAKVMAALERLEVRAVE